MSKYRISGIDALPYLNRLVTRDVSKIKMGRVGYSVWCGDDGRVIDDGTISRLEEHRFRITAADLSLRWFQECGYGMDAETNVLHDFHINTTETYHDQRAK